MIGLISINYDKVPLMFLIL